MAKNFSAFYFTIILITSTCISFFIFDCPYLYYNVNPAIPIIGGLLFVYVMCTLFRTSFTDPGVIPRATPDEAADVEKQIEIPNGTNSPTYRPPPRTKEIIINNQTIKLKYCFTCKIFRPPRASHCSLCDNCVERFDHHCPWVGNCVGRRNYRYFYMFIISLAILCVFVFACIITHLILLSKNKSLLESVKESPASVIEGIVCFFSVWSILGLAGFHTYLTTSNQTTNEDIKGSFSSKRNHSIRNPYSKGSILKNCCMILCGPSYPSLIDPKSSVPKDSQYLPTKSSYDYYQYPYSSPMSSGSRVHKSIDNSGLANVVSSSPSNMLMSGGTPLGSKSITEHYQQMYNQHINQQRQQQHQHQQQHQQQQLQQQQLQQQQLQQQQQIQQQQQQIQQQHQQSKVLSTSMPVSTQPTPSSTSGLNGSSYNSLPRHSHIQPQFQHQHQHHHHHHQHYGNNSNVKTQPYYTLSRFPSYKIMCDAESGISSLTTNTNSTNNNNNNNNNNTNSSKSSLLLPTVKQSSV